jgi:BMFP domain-containing protein YqiC
MKVPVILKFKSPLRATKPNVDLVEKHVESFRGRVIPLLRRELGMDEEEAVRELEKWKSSLLHVFPRKQYDGVEQVAIPSRWILALLRSRAATMKMRLGPALVEGVEIRPYLIGLRYRDDKGLRPLTPDKLAYVTDTIVSNDRYGKRSALLMFETANPPCWTEMFYITSHHPLIKPETVEELLSFGRMGASRTQGYGTFHGMIYNGVRRK